MSRTRMIMRRSIFTFLQNIHQFTSAPCLLLLPFSIATLLSQSLISQSFIFPIIHGRLTSLFLASGFPPSSQLFSILNLKLSHALLSFIFVSPFTLSFLLLSKASTITILQNTILNSSSIFKILNPLIITQICSALFILSAHATCLSLLVISFNVAQILGLLNTSPFYLLLISAIGAIFYSVILANAYILCNLGLIVAGVEKRGGFASIVKACVVIRGRASIALSLAVAVNMALAGIEALFQYRVVRAYNRAMGFCEASMVLEGLVIGYLYAMLIVVDTIVGFVFLKGCEMDYRRVFGEEDMCLIGFGKVKGLEIFVV